MTAPIMPRKRPNEVLDYELDFTDRLNGDRIATFTLPGFPAGMTQVSTSLDDTAAKVSVWVSGGTDGQVYKVIVRAVTENGRTLEEAMLIPVTSF